MDDSDRLIKKVMIDKITKLDAELKQMHLISNFDEDYYCIVNLQIEYLTNCINELNKCKK